MSASETSLLVVAALPIIYRAWMGWRHGATTEFRHLLVNFFGVLVAIRYWQPWTETISGGLTFDPRWIALSAFVLLYTLGAMVAGFVVKLNASSYQSVKAEYVGNVLGGLAGVFSGALLGACLLGLAVVAMPGKFDNLAQAKSLAAWPRDIVRSIETSVGVAAASTGRTRYPEVTIVETPVDPQSGAAPGGAVLLQQRGKIVWQ